ncbi:MAG: PhoH family protein, partial [Acidimicrobiia bacterium]
DGIPDLAFVELDSHDVVRHRIVADIVNAYELSEARRDAARHVQTQTSAQTHSSETRSSEIGSP